jgi:voltage-dependent potassium channel beta subunit
VKYRALGRSGLKVSEVALGGWLTQGRTIDDDTTEAIVKQAFELGVNLFDTADVYHHGASEIALGKAIRSLRREDLVLATKCFWPMTDAPNDRGLSRKHIFESVHASLGRLGVDYIDLFQFHRYDPETPIDESVRAIGDLVAQGKVLYWGVSLWKPHEIVDAVNTAREINVATPISSQPPYNMLRRDIEHDVIPVCESRGLSQIVFSPLAQGVLTGKYQPGAPAPEGSRGADANSNQFMLDHMSEPILNRVQRLSELAASLKITTGQLALAWCLRQSNVSSVIVGASQTEQIIENCAASQLEVEPEVWERAEAIVAGNMEFASL